MIAIPPVVVRFRCLVVHQYPFYHTSNHSSPSRLLPPPTTTTTTITTKKMLIEIACVSLAPICFHTFKPLVSTVWNKLTGKDSPEGPQNPLKRLVRWKKSKDELRGFKKKNPSHRGFYFQFFKGVRVAAQGLFLTIPKHPTLRSRLAKLFGWCSLASGVYMLFTVPVYYGVNAFLEKGLKKQPMQYWNLVGQASPVLTLIVTQIFSKQIKCGDAYFHETMQLSNEEFDKELSAIVVPEVKVPLKEKIMRIVRMIAFRGGSKLIILLLPETKHILLPIHKVYNLYYYLGTPLAVAVSALDAIPGEQPLEEPLITFGEIVIDSYSFGKASLQPYTMKMTDPDMQVYFFNRFQGYITGLGFLFASFMKFPIISIWVASIAQVSAALETEDLISRNLTKQNRKPLLLEDKIKATVTVEEVHDWEQDSEDEGDQGRGLDGSTEATVFTAAAVNEAVVAASEETATAVPTQMPISVGPESTDTKPMA